jgi:predicted ATPase with chaperone activity
MARQPEFQWPLPSIPHLQVFLCSNTVAMTGEISVRGYVRPVGGIVCKVEAARQAGVKKIIIPKDNWQQAFGNLTDIDVVAVERYRMCWMPPWLKGSKGFPYRFGKGAECFFCLKPRPVAAGL